MKRSDLMARLEKLLGEMVVKHSGAALPELLNMAAIEIFYNGDDDGVDGKTSYAVREAMSQLRTNGFLEFEKE